MTIDYQISIRPARRIVKCLQKVSGMFRKHLPGKCGNTKRVTWVSKHDENVTIQTNRSRTFARWEQILGKVQHGHAKVMGITCEQVRDTWVVGSL
jgi:hypothetical protein